MLRSLQAIIAAIQLANPNVEATQAERFATALQEQAQIHDFDPLTGVAIIRHESRFNPRAVSPNGEDWGLGQIRARFIGGCRNTKNPLRNPTAECKAQKQRLLEPEENIRVMAELITYHRKLCRRKIGSTKFEHWLASYQGRNHIGEQRWCDPGPGTHKVMRYRDSLIRKLYAKGLLEKPR